MLSVERMSSRLVSAFALASVLGLSACSTFTALSAPQATPSHTASAVGSAAPSSKPARWGPPQVAGLVWHPRGTPVAGHYPTYIATTRSGSIGLLWMDPRLLSFRFVPGSQYPEGGSVLAADRNPSTWVPTLVAAFNGAFKLRDNVGGYYYAGVTVSRLRTGLASLVIDGRGRLSVVQWGREISSSTGLQVVRQNMRLLVDQYVAGTSPSDKNSAWGWADHNARLANRSALGELADGSLVFEYGHLLTAQDMAAGLVGLHARTAIMLDMNITQPGGFVYQQVPGGVDGNRIVPWVVHAPSVYLHPWIKDFVVALTRH
jgi:hypothetical protein